MKFLMIHCSIIYVYQFHEVLCYLTWHLETYVMCIYVKSMTNPELHKSINTRVPKKKCVQVRSCILIRCLP